MILRFLQILGISIFSLVLLAASFEVYLREKDFLKAQPANYPCVKGDPILNHVFQENCTGIAKAEALKTEKDVEYKTNSLGFRGSLPEKRKRKILLLGDSYTEGFGLSENETLSSQMEFFLKDTQVLNGGILGFTTAIYPLYYTMKWKNLPHDYVLLNFDYTDMSDDIYYSALADFAADFYPKAFPSREALPAWIMPYVYSNRSALLRFLHQEWNLYQQEKRKIASMSTWEQLVKSEPQLIEEDWLKEQNLLDCRKNFELTAKYLKKLQEQVLKNGKKFFVHTYPPGYVFKNYIMPAQNISIVRTWVIRPESSAGWHCGMNKASVAVWKKFFAKNKITHFDSHERLEKTTDPQGLYFTLDAHWNSKGAAFIARELASLIRPHISNK